MKKKLIASLLAASMLLTLSACGGKDNSTPTSATDSEQTADTRTDSGPATDAPDEAAPDNANKATQDGVYLYNGTFLATGEAVKISDGGAAIDMPSVTVYSASAKLQPDGTFDIRDNGETFVMDGSSFFSSESCRKMAPHTYGQIPSSQSIPAHCIYNNTDEEAINGIGVYMGLSFDNDFPDGDTSRSISALEINGNPAFSLDTGRTLENLMDTYGEPAGAYCKQDPSYDRPGNLCYIWKSGNYPDKTLIMVYEIHYSWSGESDNHATVKERNNRNLSFFIADYVNDWLGKVSHNRPDLFLPAYLLPVLSELGLYTE